MASAESAEAMMSINPEMLPHFQTPEIPSIPTWNGMPLAAYYAVESHYNHMYSPQRNGYSNRSSGFGENHEMSHPTAFGFMAPHVPMGHWNIPDPNVMSHQTDQGAISRPMASHQGYMHENTSGYFQHHPSPLPASKDLMPAAINEGSEASNQSDTASTASHGAPSPPDLPVGPRGALPLLPPISPMILSDVDPDMSEWDEIPASPSHYRYQLQLHHHQQMGHHHQDHHQQHPEIGPAQNEDSVDSISLMVETASNTPSLVLHGAPVPSETISEDVTNELSQGPIHRLPHAPLNLAPEELSHSTSSGSIHMEELSQTANNPVAGLQPLTNDEMAARLQLRQTRLVAPRKPPSASNKTTAPKPTRSKSNGNLASPSKKRTPPTSVRGRTATISAAEAMAPSSSRPSPPHSDPVSRASHSGVSSPSSPYMPRTPPIGPYSYTSPVSEPITTISMRIGKHDYQVSHKQYERIKKRLACPTRPSSSVQSPASPLTPSRSTAAVRRTRSTFGQFESTNKSNSAPSPKKPS